MKKEKIYVNKINKKIDNNQNYFELENKNEKIEKNIIKESDINQIDTVSEKIKEIFNINGYLFNIDVKIITRDKEYVTKIAGKVNNNLITMDNNIINIDEIKDIIILSK